MKKKKAQTKIEPPPIEVALSHLKPDEREKLKKYVAAYVAEYGNGTEQKKV